MAEGNSVRRMLMLALLSASLTLASLVAGAGAAASAPDDAALSQSI
jgi:hypothetical protein